MMERFQKSPHTLLRLCEGPLGPYLKIYAEQLSDDGYARTTGCYLLRIVGEFSQWLKRREIAVNAITKEDVLKFLKFRAKAKKSTGSERTALNRVLNILYDQGVIPRPSVPQAPANQMANEFCVYLRSERALADTTINRYRKIVVSFLSDRFSEGPVELDLLRPTQVIDFVMKQAKHLSVKSSRTVTNALRSFLKYAKFQGYISLELSTCVPAVANWSETEIPRALPAEQIEIVLNSCNRGTVTGCRDYAILLLLARLGLRSCEIATLKLEDIDWSLGCITVRGKGGRRTKLPLPADVGEAIADYVQYWRAQIPDRSVFLRRRAPIAGFGNPGAISSIVCRALTRAEVESPRKGAHQFRHGLATEMLRQGASLAEIGELLGHASPRTTQIYAKVDLASLRTIAIAWPGGEK